MWIIIHRQFNVRATLLQTPVPNGFNYQPIFLEPNTAKILHCPLISKQQSLSSTSNSTRQIDLSDKQSPKQDNFDSTSDLEKTPLINAKLLGKEKTTDTYNNQPSTIGNMTHNKL